MDALVGLDADQHAVSGEVDAGIARFATDLTQRLDELDLEHGVGLGRDPGAVVACKVAMRSASPENSESK